MRRVLIPAMVACLGFVCSFTTGACGGGGTIFVVDPLTLFSGTYCLSGFEGDVGVPDEAKAQWGSLTPDGAGMVGASLLENVNGVLGGPFVQPPLPYTVDASGRLTLLVAGVPFLRGGLSAGGRLGCLAMVSNGVAPSIYLLGRKSSGLGTASLNGAYHAIVFFYDHTSMEDGTLFGATVTFDGAGTNSAAGSQNLQGVQGPVGPLPGTYSVAANGALLGDFFGGLVAVQGVVLLGGDVVLASGSTTAGEFPLLLALVKKTAGATNATLSGTYHTVGIRADNAPPPETWVSTVATISADGAGMASLGASTRNDDGVVTDLPAAGGAPYTVAGDGALDGNGGAVLGGVSASGDVAIFAGGSGAGDEPEFFFLMR